MVEQTDKRLSFQLFVPNSFIKWKITVVLKESLIKKHSSTDMQHKD